MEVASRTTMGYKALWLYRYLWLVLKPVLSS